METVTATTADVVEQVMRVTSDDLDVLPFLSALPASRSALSALGRLLGRHDLVLAPGCPVVAWATGTSLDASWRSAYPPRPGSLWEDLQFLSALYGTSVALNPYEQLEELRANEHRDGF